jgi:hypothetical protein
MSSESQRLLAVFAEIDAANSLDPKSVEAGGGIQPANLIYGRRMSEELERFEPDATEALRIAARGQHIERWIIPRSQYPMDRQGYHQWRRMLREHHAKRLAEILGRFDYDATTIGRVASIVRKERPKSDPEVQTLEDVICIVFLKYELDGFAQKYAEGDERLALILAKTWGKMSERGHAAALALPPPPAVVALLHLGLEKLKASAPPGAD